VRVDLLREQPVLRAVPQQCAVREVRQRAGAVKRAAKNRAGAGILNFA